MSGYCQNYVIQRFPREIKHPKLRGSGGNYIPSKVTYNVGSAKFVTSTLYTVQSFRK